MSAAKIQAWIKVGYRLLGAERLEGMKIERLARAMKLNKSGFYYYFGSMSNFVKCLLEYHAARAAAISLEISMCRKIDPDLLLVVIRHKDFFLVESNLLVRPKNTLFEGDFDAASNIIGKAMLPLWRKTSGVDIDSRTALAYVNIIRHFIYARIDKEHLNYEYLHDLMAETREVLSKVTHDRGVLR